MKEVYSFKSADGISTIHVVKWTPDEGRPIAVLQITHGMVEYIERYTEFAEYLNSRGIAVMGHDHIGHGHSVDKEEDWGVMHHRNPSDCMIEDMMTNYLEVEKAFSGIPHFMLGHSMGSYMLRKFLCEKADKIGTCKGAIVMGTGTESDVAISMGLVLIKVMAAFKGWSHRSSMIAGMTQGAAYKEFDTTGKEPERSWLSKNVENVKAYYQDPMCTYQFSLSGYKGLLEACLYDNKPANIAKMRKDMPVLVVSGANDPVGNLGEGVRQAYQKFCDAGLSDVTISLYEDDRHEILNELDRADVYNDLYDWMMSRI